MTEPQLVEELVASFSEQAPSEPDHVERGLVLLGLASSGGAFEPRAIAAQQARGLLGMYRFGTQDVVIIDRGVPADTALANGTLLHEFVHALQDREFNLAAFSEAYATDDDTAFAVAAVMEGEAELHELRYRASLHGLDPDRADLTAAFDSRIRSDEAELVANDSPFFASREAFAYGYGGRFVHDVWRAEGMAGVRALYATPPRSTRDVMASAHGDSPAPDVPNLPAAPAGWALVEDSTLGAWGVFMALTRELPPEDARRLALGWRGDRIALYAERENDAQTVVLWRIQFSDDATATAAQPAFEHLGSDAARVEGSRLVIALATVPTSLEWSYAEE